MNDMKASLKVAGEDVRSLKPRVEIPSWGEISGCRRAVGTRSTGVPDLLRKNGDAGGTRPYQIVPGPQTSGFAPPILLMSSPTNNADLQTGSVTMKAENKTKWQTWPAWVFRPKTNRVENEFAAMRPMREVERDILRKLSARMRQEGYGCA
jgi:hypothetical protein